MVADGAIALCGERPESVSRRRSRPAVRWWRRRWRRWRPGPAPALVWRHRPGREQDANRSKALRQRCRPTARRSPTSHALGRREPADARSVAWRRTPRSRRRPSASMPRRCRPTGARVAYQMMTRDDWEIYMAAARRHGESRLTRDNQHDVLPRFIGTDRLLVVVGEPRHRRSFLYNLTTGERTRLFHNNTVRTIAPEYQWIGQRRRHAHAHRRRARRQYRLARARRVPVAARRRRSPKPISSSV